MQHKHLRFGQGFNVVLDHPQAQAAQMTLAPGETEGGPDNRHRGADQWLFVISGCGLALIDGEQVDLRENSLVLIERGEFQEIRNPGQDTLQTLSFYIPPAYTEDGNELPAGRK
jgi:mannose-6-phosphate isomerase-like protein (cupin superfamily)